MGKGFWRLQHDDLAALLRRHLGGRELRVALALGSLTVGFGKPKDTVTAGQIAAVTGDSRSHVHDVLTALQEEGIAKQEAVEPHVIRRWLDVRGSPETGAPDSPETGPPGSTKTVLPDSTKTVLPDSTKTVLPDSPGSTKTVLPDSTKTVALQEVVKNKKEPPASAARAPGADRKSKPKPNVWALWIRAWRESGREPPPMRVGSALAAAKRLGELIPRDIPDEAALFEIFRRFLADDDPFLVKQGHNLALLSSRIDRYTQPAAEAAGRREDVY